MPAPTAVTIDRKDSRFDTLKKGHNLRFPATEAEAASRVVLCADAGQIAEALQRVVSSGLRPTVRSGGHCYEDFVANNPNGAILDLSLHNAVDADPSGVYYISAGAQLGVAYLNLYKRFNKTLPAGSCYTVGAGGHISGGGYGVLSRLHGLTVDWISEVDVLTVDASGKVVQHRASKSREPDLFRACRGAGNGQFGIVTSFRFDKLPPAPQQIAMSNMSFSWDGMTEARFTKILTTYGDYFASRGKDPDTWGLFTGMGLSNRGVPGNPGQRGAGHIGIGAQFCNPDGTCRDLAPLHEFFARFKDLNPTVITPTRINTNQSSNTTVDQHDPAAETARNYYQVNVENWLDATIGDSGSGGGTRAKYKSSYMKETFTPAECSAIYKALTSQGDGHSAILAVDSYGGAVNNPDRLHDTSIAQRSSIMKLQWQSYWREKKDDAPRMQYMDEYYTAVYTGSHVDPKYQGTPLGPGLEGCYMNYPDVDMLRYSFWPELYYGRGDLYPFLQKVKQKYDPNNIFHNSMSIRA